MHCHLFNQQRFQLKSLMKPEVMLKMIIPYIKLNIIMQYIITLKSIDDLVIPKKSYSMETSFILFKTGYIYIYKYILKNYLPYIYIYIYIYIY